MEEYVKQQALKILINAFLSQITPERLNYVGDKILDVIEDAVEKTENKIDDALILPLCSLTRQTFKIKD